VLKKQRVASLVYCRTSKTENKQHRKQKHNTIEHTKIGKQSIKSVCLKGVEV